MFNIIFLSYIAKLVGTKSIELESRLKTIADVFDFLINEFPSIKTQISGESPEVIILMGEKSLLLPRDLHLEVMDNIYISPIIAGG